MSRQTNDTVDKQTKRWTEAHSCILAQTERDGQTNRKIYSTYRHDRAVCLDRDKKIDIRHMDK